MGVFNLVGTLVDDMSTRLRGLGDIDLITLGSNKYLAVASEADSAISIFSFTANGGYTALGSIGYSNSSGTRTVWDLNFATVSGQTILLPATRYEDQTALFALHSDGSLSGPKNAAPASVASTGIGVSVSISIGPNTFVFAQTYGAQTLGSYQIFSDRSLVEIQTLSDSPNTFLGDISALDTTQVAGQDYLFVASAYDGGIAVYSVASDGRLTLSDTVLPTDGTGFALLGDLATINLGGAEFLIAASAGTGGLISYQVSPAGVLSEKGHILDTLDTRFQAASTIETFTFDGRAFVVAAGSDDGVTLLELLSDGSFVVHGSVADTYATTLNNVTGLAVGIINSVPVLFVSSGVDNGFSQFALTIGPTPVIPPPDPAPTGKQEDMHLDGSTAADTLTGGASNDIIQGFEQKDTLIDGAGRDSLRGGGGADTFVFVQDGAVDRIEDFNPQLDIIDLSRFSAVASMADINIVGLPEQVVIELQGEIIILANENHGWDVTDLTANHFIF